MFPRIRIWALHSLLMLANQGCFAVLLDSDQIENHEYLSRDNGSTEEIKRASLDSDDLLDFDRVDEITVPVANLATEVAVVPIQESIDSNATSESEAVGENNVEKQAPNFADISSGKDAATFTGNVSNSQLSQNEEERSILAETGLSSSESSVETSTNEHLGIETMEPSSTPPTDELEIEDSIVKHKIELSSDDVVKLGVGKDEDATLASGMELGIDAMNTKQDALDVDSEVDSDFEPEMDSGVVSEVEVEIKGKHEITMEKGVEPRMAGLDDQSKITSDAEIGDETSAEQTRKTVIENSTTTADNITLKAEASQANYESPTETAPPKPGSLASFFKQVSEKEKERDERGSSPELDQQKEDYSTGKAVDEALRISTTMMSGSIIEESLTMHNNADKSEPSSEQDTGRASSMHRDLTSHTELLGIRGNNEEEDRAYGYTAVWGRQTKHTPNKHLLHEVAHKNSATDPSQNADETIHTEDNSARIVTLGVDDSDADSPETGKEKESRIPLRKSVNTQFVEGLDDINKFLEEVEPPDELDVGASGSSLQEVLIGQGAQILSKRVTIIFARIKQSFGATRIKQFFASRRTADGEFTLFTRDELKRAGQRLWNGCRSVAGKVHEMWEDLFDDDYSLQFEVELGHEASKLDSIRHRLLDENRLAPNDRRGSSRHFASATRKGEGD